MTQLITITGNVGADPTSRIIPSKWVTRRFYDPLIDDEVERDYQTREKEVRNFSLAVDGEDEDGEKITRWIRCSDWKELSLTLRKGDFVRVAGEFQQNAVERDGETRIYRNFIVHELRILRRNRRKAQAA